VALVSSTQHGISHGKTIGNTEVRGEPSVTRCAYEKQSNGLREL